MNRVPAGWETDLAILRHSGSLIEEFDDHVVIRSPHNPDYHWGNFVLVSDKGAAEDADKWIRIFQLNFPDATWVAIGLTEYPDSAAEWTLFDVEIERLDVLRSLKPPATPPLPPTYTSRILEGADWDALADREISENLRTGDHDPETFEGFIRRSIEGYQELCERGAAAWFGAFSGTELAADLGIVICGETARYQSVHTAEQHRRQGLASHLLGKSARWASTKGCTSWVIVTESTNAAGRVYRRAGFTPECETVTAYRPPQPTPRER